MKTTVPDSIGGMNVAMACPNMWLSGSRFRNLSGLNGFAYVRYFSTSPSTGTMFARIFLCVITTPFGSAVAPDVKMISATSSRVMVTAGGRPVADQSRWCSGHVGVCPRPRIGGTSWPSRTTRASTMRATRTRKSGDER